MLPTNNHRGRDALTEGQSSKVPVTNRGLLHERLMDSLQTSVNASSILAESSNYLDQYAKYRADPTRDGVVGIESNLIQNARAAQHI